MTSWNDKKKLAEMSLKQKYNRLRTTAMQMDDGTVEIVSDPIFRQINRELKATTDQIKSLCKIGEYDLIKGFQI